MNPWIPHLLRAAGRGSTLPSSGQTFYTSLKTSLVPEVGTGGPTWSRATAAWRFNDMGVLRQIPTGCAEFGGARLVTNLCPTPSSTLAVAGTKTVTLTAAATLQFSMGAGTGTATFSGTGGATGTLAAGSGRVSVNKTVTAGTFIVTASVADLVDLSIVDVTGRDASYIPEYVSVGVLSAPYHGAGVDGSKYFTTDSQGAPIPVANLTRLRKESAATNVLLWSRDLAGQTWMESGGNFTSSAWITSVTGSNLVTNGDFASGLSGWNDNGASTNTWSGGRANLDGTGGVGGIYQGLTTTVGKTYLITASMTVISGSGNAIVSIKGATVGSTTIKYDGSTVSKNISIIFKATLTNHVLYIYTSSGRISQFDDIVVKECTCAPERTIAGLDGIANSATTLTATATDAIILQPTSGIASAARCSSAYVKRVTGTGTISFTQDGGSTWTDITSLINPDTFSRVQITSTLANPSVGFKIGTSGDVIAVDCVQNEAGSVATSPIVTTTATVTRNADSLTYQTSGNWSDTAGTAYLLARPVVYSGGAVGSATNGLLLSASNSGATAYDGTNSANGPIGTPGATEKLMLAWGSSTMNVASSGLVGTPGTYDGAMGLSSIGVGVSAVGYFGDVAIYNYKMTDAELQAITSTLPSSGQTFYTSLKTSLVPEVGTGGPTWSRATAAWRFNDQGYLRQIPSGCAEFGGARLVTNLCPTPSNTLAVAGTKTVTLTAAATLQFSMGAGTGTATFSGTGGATGTLAAGASRVSVNKTVTAGTFVVTASVADLVDLSIVDVTGRDASYIPEYVSVGVLSAPYHGAGVDGSKYFATDWQGAPIPVANLTRLRKESAATNALLWSRDFVGQTWSETGGNFTPGAWIPSVTGPNLVTNGDFASDLSGWTNNGASTNTWSGGKANIDGTGGVGGIYQAITTTIGKTYLITVAMTAVSGSGNAVVAIKGATVGSSTIRYDGGSVSKNISLIFKATLASHVLNAYASAGRVAQFDDVIVKECTCVPERTATGLDGIANSATTLTATAADAIILQPITLASAARCASAYVERISGTGTISFTQDGGSTWTNITPNINPDTYSRVQITATLANPSVGFKISTAGDVIAVDCVQNEAGSVATSPIVTTTATVTRNADSLTYQTAGNIDFAVGTAYCEAQLTSATSTRRAIYVGAVAASFIDGGTTVWKAYDGTNTVTKSGLSDASTAKRKRVVTWGTGMSVTGDGLTPASGLFDGAFGGAATIEIGQAINGYIGPVAIYNYQMTDAELQAITT